MSSCVSIFTNFFFFFLISLLYSQLHKIVWFLSLLLRNSFVVVLFCYYWIQSYRRNDANAQMFKHYNQSNLVSVCQCESNEKKNRKNSFQLCAKYIQLPVIFADSSLGLSYENKIKQKSFLMDTKNTSNRITDKMSPNWPT